MAADGRVTVSDRRSTGRMATQGIVPPMALEMRTSCERCQAPLDAGGDVRICSYECSFCAACAESMQHVCPNCGGELVRRPTRR